MKDITHYFGQSPRSDESSSSLKENEEGSSPAQEKSVLKKAASSDVLKCKTPSNNLNIEAESPKPISELAGETQQKNLRSKKKSVRKKKVSASDEDFEVKSAKKTVKTRGRPKKEKNSQADVPDTKNDKQAPEIGNDVTKADIASSCSEGSLDQCVVSKQNATLTSPTNNEDISENKPKSVINIMHFFSPTKGTGTQPASNHLDDDNSSIAVNSSDEDFEVKSAKKTVKTRGRPKKKKNSQADVPDTKNDKQAPEIGNDRTKADIASSCSEGSLDQCVVSKQNATLTSPTNNEDISENKPKSVINIMHFFSPTKSTGAQPASHHSDDDNPSIAVNSKNIMHFFSLTKSTGSQPASYHLNGDNPSIAVNSKKETLPQSERRVRSKKESVPQSEEKVRSKREPVKKGNKKLQEESSDFKPDITKNISGPLSKGNRGDAQSPLAHSPIKESFQQNKSSVKASVCNAFQMLMSKKQNSQAPTDDLKSDEGWSSNILPEGEDKDLQEGVPKEFMKRKKRNRIESETDDDSLSEVGNQQKKMATEVDTTPNQDGSKKKSSMMNYFQKISKEEAEIQSQKVQFKVEAIVHHSEGSPFKSELKKEVRSQKIPKKKKVRQKRNEDEIEWLGSEEVTVEDTHAEKVEPAAQSLPEVSSKLDQEAQEKSQESETNATGEVLSSSLPKKTKRSLKLNSSPSRPSRSKHPKKIVEPSENENKNGIAAVEESTPQTRDTVDNGPTESSLQNTSKIAVKKFKQVSLMESPFLRKLSFNDSISEEIAEAPTTSETSILQSIATVSLSRILPCRLTKAANAQEIAGKSPLQSKEKKNKSPDVPDNVEVTVSWDEGVMKSPPKKFRGIFSESPKSPEEQSDVTTPQPRSWKMRVCLTPKVETNKANPPVGSPITMDTGSDDAFDVQEIAVVKKKKRKKKKSESETKETSPSSKEEGIEIVYEEKVTDIAKTTVKLAPLFMRPKKPDRISEQAKQEFLLSGVPEQLKKMIEIQKSIVCTEVEMFPLISHVTQLDEVLPWTSSEGQLPLKAALPESDPAPSESLKMGDMTTCDPVGCEMADVLPNYSASLHRQKRRIAMEHVPAVLSLVRTEDPNFEVVRYFKLLREKYRKVLDPKGHVGEIVKTKRAPRRSRRSRGSNQTADFPQSVRPICSLMWTDKYRPTSSDDIVGNKETVQELKQWLEGLRRISQAGQVPVFKPKRSKKTDNEDDFVVSDENFDSNSSSVSLSNSALLLGPHGSGKTNCVYALAADLGYKVLEINASERRNGKIILAKLSEATQSHQVASRSQEQTAATANFFKSNTSSKPKASKRKPEKKNECEEDSTQNKLSLILIKDIDVVFEEEDEGFVSAVASLISTSKRPVIFTTTEADCASVKRLINSATLLLQFAPDTDALCSWLQIVALVEGIYVSRTALKDLLSSCNGDVRRCLLQLQVWMSTGGNHLSGRPNDDDSAKEQEKALLEEFLEGDINEEDLNAEVNRSSLSMFEHHDCIGALQGRNDIDLERETNKVTIPLPMSFGRVWWNVPRYLSLPQVQVSQLVLPDIPEEPRRFRGIFDDSLFDMSSDDEDGPNRPNSKPTKPTDETNPPSESKAKPPESESAVKVNVKRCSQEEVDAMLSHLQAMSVCDLIAKASHLPELSADFEPTPKSWQNVPRASLAQSTPMTDGPNLLVEEISRSLCHWLTENSIEHTRSIVHKNPEPGRYDAFLPGHQIQRRRLDVADSEQAALKVVASCVQLERAAIFLDYLPTLRTICASEQKRSEKSCSRRKRFYHYFQNFGLTLSADQAVVFSST